jgi:hypothetical protein
MPGRAGGGVMEVRFSEMISSADLATLSFWLLAKDQSSIWASSLDIVLEFEAGTTSVASSAYLSRTLPGVAQCKSLELMMNIEGPKAEPWTTLAVISRQEEVTELNFVQWEREEKKARSQE